jgi:hypothetical protein
MFSGVLELTHNAGFLVWSSLTAIVALCGVGQAKASTFPEPQVYAAGSISSTSPVECFSLTQDGKTAFFDRYVGSRFVAIMESHRTHGRWSKGQIAAFSGEWFDQAPAVSRDSSFLIFASNRPDAPGGRPSHGGNLWRTDRIGDAWSTPVRLSEDVNFGGHIYAPSIAANGDLYFSSADNPQHLFHVYRATWSNGKYQKAVVQSITPQDAPAGTEELDPAVAPDETFMLFSAGVQGSPRPYHLYLAFRDRTGWTAPVDFDPALDPYEPDCPQLGPDGTTLYFTSKYTGPTQWARRSREQTERDLALDSAWDNGVTHIWTLSLLPWLQAKSHDAAAAK